MLWSRNQPFRLLFGFEDQQLGFLLFSWETWDFFWEITHQKYFTFHGPHVGLALRLLIRNCRKKEEKEGIRSARS